jgi:hypothetical protein
VRHLAKKVLKTGAIEFSGGGGISCAVKNLSASGASLEVVSALDIPDRLTLFIRGEHLKRPCHVVWRKETRIGVAFGYRKSRDCNSMPSRDFPCF